jgi:predicted ABC-type ATPase
MLARLKNLAAQRQDFAFETTFASRSHAVFLRRLKGEGYAVNIAYLWLQSPEIAIERVQSRVRKGGHNIPEDVIQNFLQ